MPPTLRCSLLALTSYGLVARTSGSGESPAPVAFLQTLTDGFAQ